MTGDQRGNGGDDLSGRLRRLDEKLDAREAEEMRKQPAPSANAADRFGGVVAGFAVGWAFDKLTGWSPWGLIVFLLLGFAAGVLNVLRSIGALPKYGERRDK